MPPRRYFRGRGLPCRDQHGTAVIVGAAMLNAVKVQRKNISDIRLVVNGAGAAAIACSRLLVGLGVSEDNIVMCDSRGVIYKGRPGLNKQKEQAQTQDFRRGTALSAPL